MVQKLIISAKLRGL